MKILTEAEIASNFNRVLDDVEESHEEVVVTRNQRIVARIIPEPPEQNALEVFGDLCGILADATADDLMDPVKTARGGNGGTLDELLNPWAS